MINIFAVVKYSSKPELTTESVISTTLQAKEEKINSFKPLNKPNFVKSSVNNYGNGTNNINIFTYFIMIKNKKFKEDNLIKKNWTSFQNSLFNCYNNNNCSFIFMNIQLNIYYEIYNNKLNLNSSIEDSNFILFSKNSTNTTFSMC